MQKIVQGATKPKKGAAPKAKYIDPIVQSTFGDTAAFKEVMRTLQSQLSSDNVTVVHKSLVVVHTLLRSGNIDSVFDQFSTATLSLSVPQSSSNLVAYAGYLSARLKSYSNLQRDVIRDKTDRRAPTRMRSLTVDKGLLREVRETQRMIAAAVEAKFYLDDVDDDCSMTSLRLVVKDLLVLFTAVNEGVINVLEHYFEMSKPDATTALKIYKTFVRDTEKVVAYLGVAKKMFNIIQVQIPNLKHAPVSLVNSLEEYLNDPNFEKNREEYKENKRVADGGTPRAKTPTPATNSAAHTSTNASTSTSAAQDKKPTNFADFFESIEEAQQPMFPNSPAMPTGFQPYGVTPFAAAYGQQPFLQPQATGNPFAAFGGLQPQMTGFMQPQMTGANPFRMSMMQPQMTGNPFLRPQMTGSPFASTLSQPPSSTGPFGMQPQPTGAPFNAFSSAPQASSPFAPQASSSPFGQASAPLAQSQPQPQSAQAAPAQSPPPQSQQQQPQQTPSWQNGSSSNTQPASSFTSAQQSAPALVPQKTGARNPFAPAPGTVINPPPEPKKPSMNEMAQNAFQRYQQQQRELEEQQKQSQSQSNGSTNNAFDSLFDTSSQPAALTPVKTGMMGNIASEFALNKPSASAGQHEPPTSSFSSLSITSSQPTGSAPSTSTFSTPSTLTAQPTGSGGRKAFQPTSEFGSKLASEIGATPLSFGAATSPTGAGGPTSPLSSQPTGFNPYRPSAGGFQTQQATGFGSGSAFGFGGNGTNATTANANGNSNGFAGYQGGSTTGTLI